MEVAQKIIGMSIESKNGIYVVTATKPYFGGSTLTGNRPRVHYGSIMMFSVRGHPFACVSTGTGREQDYFLLARIRSLNESVQEIDKPSGVSKALGLHADHDGVYFSHLFKLYGETKPSTFQKSEKEAATCLGEFRII
jgi:hypothetical protein